MSGQAWVRGRVSSPTGGENHRVRALATSLLSCWLCVLPAAAQGPLGTAFTYQGRLDASGNPTTGGYDFRFTLYDATILGNVIGTPVTVSSVAVAAGLFTVSLDFGASAFVGGKRWLEIGVKPAGSPSGYTLLTPRQELTPTPNAVFSATTGDASVQRRTVAPSCSVGQYVRSIAADGTPTCVTDSNSGGTVTSVTAGAGLSGGTIVGAGTVAIAPGGVVSSMIANGAVGLAKLSTLNAAVAGKVVAGTGAAGLRGTGTPSC